MDNDDIVNNVFRLGEIMATGNRYADDIQALCAERKFAEVATVIERQSGAHDRTSSNAS